MILMILAYVLILGVIVLWTGFGLASANWIATITIATFTFIVYAYRIKREEAMLVAVFGEKYKEYIARTRKLIPYIY